MQSIKVKILNWRVEDETGFLRVTAKILKEGVFKYAVSDMPPDLAKEFTGKDKARDFIPAEEFTAEALKSLEGKPVVVNAHEWQTAKQETIEAVAIGNVAGKPTVSEKFIVCDLLITDEAVIKKITSKELVEVSAGYDSNTEIKSGKNGDEEYDAIQHNLRFNHILLLPEGQGRCGYEVRIYNKTGSENIKEIKTMFELHIVNSKGHENVYRFQNEEDKKEAKKMVKDTETQNAEEMEAQKKDNEVKKNALETSIAQHKVDIDRLTKEAAELTKQLEEFSSEEHQEKELNAREEYKKDEEAVMNAEVDEKDREKTKKDIDEETKNCAGKKMNARMKALTVRVMNAKGIDLKDATDEVIATTFKTLAASAKKSGPRQKKENRLPIPGQKKNEGDTKHPVFQRPEAPSK